HSPACRQRTEVFSLPARCCGRGDMGGASVGLAAALTWLLGLGAASAETPAQYELTPVVVDGALARMAVELRFTGEPDGKTRLQLPNRYGGETELWRHVTNLRVEGARARAGTGPDQRTLHHPPGGAVTVRYQIEPGYAEDPPTGGNPYRPIIRPSLRAADERGLAGCGRLGDGASER
ncbi:MAG: hypothetical protein KY449_11790, partial [Proteobacteria bacterium]|nr:hypothetical protein [Pseudomonadota bacterium]